MSLRKPTSAGTLGSASHRDLEKRAVEAVLAWESFDRSKNLCKLLMYICNRYFEGRADEIKEYNLAVDALERPPDFDQKKDAIVRVEMHRLRKRLREYYAGPGANDPVQILLAEKGYVPEFVFSSAAPRLAGVTPVADPEISAPGIEKGRAISSKIRIGLAAALLLAVLAGVVFHFRPRTPPATRTPPVEAAAAAAPGPVAAPASGDLRILAGRGPGTYSDRDGQVWEGDRYFRGGEAIACRSDIVTRGFDRNLFASMREGTFEYAIPLPPGSYEAELLFAETLYGEGNPLGGGETSREFDILVNGAPRVQRVDILWEAGMPNAADSRVLKDVRPGSDGLLHLGFQPAPGRNALVNAIWIRPGQPGRLRPIRIAARAQAYQDSVGRWWLPDRYYLGGNQVFRPTVPLGVDDPYLFQGERYGDFTYSIPVAPGRYAATLYLSEYWWGEGRPGGAGKRRFDVYCNFKPLLTGFDIVSEGGRARAVTKTFHGLTPNPQGKLVFAFVSQENFALLNAVEIVDESR